MPAPLLISPTNRPWSRQLLRRLGRCLSFAPTLSADMRTRLASLRRLNNPGYICTLNTELDERKGQERRCYTKDLSTAQVLRTRVAVEKLPSRKSAEIRSRQ